MGTIVVLALIVIVVVVMAVKGFRIVQQAETLVVERLGKYHRTLHSGVNILWPFFDLPRRIQWRFVITDINGQKIVRKQEVERIDLRETVYDFPRQNVITKDNVTIIIDALLYFQVTDPMKAVYEIANLPDAIEKLTQTTLRNVIGELDLDQTLASRETINSKLRAILDEATYRWGVKVNRVELQEISPPEDIRGAMEKQMRAERDRRAVILEAEGQKTSVVLIAEGQREAAVARAEGEKMAAILRAEGEAQARLTVAEAEAQSIKKITETIRESKGDPASYLIAMKYIETLKEMVSGKDNKVVYIPYEASGVLGSVGLIKDMFKGGEK
jgi:regulator of protease activity HflC (stomatin/prohibitin superfamily)